MTDLLERRDGAVLILTMNRPDRRNALSGDMQEMLAEAVARAAHDDSVGCVVLTGTGTAFCAGGDVKGMADRGGGSSAVLAGNSFDSAVLHLRRRMESSRLLHEMPKPTIALIPGAAAGAGLSLALACDLRIAAAGAKMTTAFANVAFSGDYGGTWYLQRLVGAAKARELYYFSTVFTAEEALEMGIVNKVVPHAELEAIGMEWAHRLANGPRVGLSYMKRNLNTAERSSLGELLDQEALYMTRTGQTEDHKEAAKAFTEKRKPNFVGR